jgi:tetratricopeptide (TPR) repeat protein
VQARAFIGASNLAGRSGDYATFSAWLERGRALAESIGDQEYMAWARIGLSLQNSDYAQVSALLAEAIALARAAENDWLVADILFLLGDRARANGDHQRAQALYQNSIRLFRQVGDGSVIANPIGNLGRLAFERGDYGTAHRAFEQSIDLSRQVGNKPGMADWLMQLARVALYQSEYLQVPHALAEGLPICLEINNQEALADCLVIAAGLAQATGAPEQAARLLGAAARILEEFNLLHQVVDPANYAEFTRRVDEVRGQVAVTLFERAWAEGHGLSMAAAVDCALAAYQ